MTAPPDTEAPADPSPPAPPLPEPRTGGWVGLGIVASVALLAATLLAATWLGRVSREPPVPLTAIVTVLPYLYALTLALLFAAWSAVPDRRLLPALLGVVTIVAALLWGPTLPGWSEPDDGDAVRVVTWNVRRLWGGPSDGGDPAACVVKVLREIDADLLSLQEVSANDVGRLERELGVSCVQADYLGTGDPAAGGVAACVRPGPWAWRSGTHARFVHDKAWRYAFLEAERDGRVVNLVAAHLEPYRLAAGGLQHAAAVSAAQGDQSAELLRRVTRFRDPTILAGDFNSTRDAAMHVALRGLMRDAFEVGGRGFGPTFFLFDRVPIRIDHVYVTHTFAVRGARVVARDCSDHRPMVADLTLRRDP
jgi:endonuclease/exonuclease/phosphatase (EEP) superfamily protein YafD